MKKNMIYLIAVLTVLSLTACSKNTVKDLSSVVDLLEEATSNLEGNENQSEKSRSEDNDISGNKKGNESDKSNQSGSEDIDKSNNSTQNSIGEKQGNTKPDDEDEEEPLSWDDPDYEEKKMKRDIKNLEKEFARVLEKPDFSFNGLVSQVSFTNNKENELNAIIAGDDPDALTKLMISYLPEGHDHADSNGINHTKITHRGYPAEFTLADSQKSYAYGDVFSVVNMLGMVTVKISKQNVSSSNPVIQAYLDDGAPYTVAEKLAKLDELEPGVYSVSAYNDYKFYVCENGDVVRDNQSGSRLYAVTADFKAYDLMTGYVTDKDETDYAVYDFSKNHVDYYVTRAEYFADWDSYGTISKKKFANVSEVFEVLRSGIVLKEWGDLEDTYGSTLSYEQVEHSFYDQKFLISGYEPKAIHESRTIDYLGSELSDSIVCTRMGRNCYWYDKDYKVMYTVNTRTVHIDPGKMDTDMFNRLVKAFTEKGVSEVDADGGKNRMRWKGTCYCYTEYIDDQAFEQYDDYEVEWGFGNDNPDEDYCIITINYWYHTIYV